MNWDRQPLARTRVAELEYRHLFRHVQLGVAILEALDEGNDFIVQDANPTIEKMSHLDREFLVGRRLTDVLPTSARLGLLERVKRTWRTGAEELGPDAQSAGMHNQNLGSYRLLRLPSGRVAALFDGKPMPAAAREQVRELAFIDPLTELPNRRLLLDRLQQALATSLRKKLYGGLLFIDLDNFKALNDTRGHAVGDMLLIEVARRLQQRVREVDTVARYGGDEFVVLLEGLSGIPDKAADECKDVASKILIGLNQPFLLSGQEFWCSASMGISLFQGKEFSVDEILKRADTAMYQAKTAGRNAMRFFDPAMQAAVSERAAMEAALRQALEQREFRLRYQPQVDSSGKLVGAEALVYWRHPSRGILHAADFVPLAEETGLILYLGQQVLKLACGQLAAWQHTPMAGLPLAVNIGMRQFHEANFVDQVRAALASSGASPRLLRLELTEGLIFKDLEDTRKKMQALQGLGVRFSLDDFGTGFSSLAQFKHLHLDQVKIDKSFVHNFITDPGDAAVARSVIAMGKMFGIAVIAEGVETFAQRDFLVQQGCATLQGNLFGAPVPVDVFMASYVLGRQGQQRATAMPAPYADTLLRPLSHQHPGP